ncbi:cold shock domain-containing protein [Nocardia tengchongensis]|uniref:cold shock domain-containing protein n=1 Tax=Nocardia tengchongensis TaxID=2055889 RepID=UPI0024848CED|nr:cold shock domain-containing protein [Nocardia tengchongensis]
MAWFDARKGFGIIQPSDGSGPVFIEFSRIDGCGYRVLSQGQQVLFTRDADGRHSEAALACPAGNLRHETWLDSTT